MVDRRCILAKEHKMTDMNYIDANPSAVIVEVIKHLLKRFNDLKASHITVYSFM